VAKAVTAAPRKNERRLPDVEDSRRKEESAFMICFDPYIENRSMKECRPENISGDQENLRLARCQNTPCVTP